MAKPGKSPRAQSVPAKSVETLSVSDRYKKQITYRFWMFLNHLTIPLFSGLTFAFTALCEFLLFKLVWFLSQGDLQQIEIAKTLARYAQIGIIGTSLIGMLVHTGYSLYGTIQTEMLISKEELA